MMVDVEAHAYSHRIREAEAPFIYESTAVLAEIDLERPMPSAVRVGCSTLASVGPCRAAGTTPSTFAREAFDLCDDTGRWAVGCSS